MPFLNLLWFLMRCTKLESLYSYKHQFISSYKQKLVWVSGHLAEFLQVASHTSTLALLPKTALKCASMRIPHCFELESTLNVMQPNSLVFKSGNSMATSQGDTRYELEGFHVVFRLAYLIRNMAVKVTCVRCRSDNGQQRKRGFLFRWGFHQRGNFPEGLPQIWPPIAWPEWVMPSTSQSLARQLGFSR